MVAVTIDLWPFGFSEKSKSLVVIAIWNDGGNKTVADYQYRISHQFGTDYAEKAKSATGIETPTAFDLCFEENRPWVWNSGKIENFTRQKGAASLLAVVMEHANVR